MLDQCFPAVRMIQRHHSGNILQFYVHDAAANIMLALYKTFYFYFRKVLLATGGAPWLDCRYCYVRQLYSHDLSLDVMPWPNFLFYFYSICAGEFSGQMYFVCTEVEPDYIAYHLYSIWHTYKHMHSLSCCMSKKDKTWNVDKKYSRSTLPVVLQFVCLFLGFFYIAFIGARCFPLILWSNLNRGCFHNLQWRVRKEMHV